MAGIPHEDPVRREAGGTEGTRHAEKLDSTLPCTSRPGPPSFLAEGKTDTFLAPAFLGSLGLTFSRPEKPFYPKHNGPHYSNKNSRKGRVGMVTFL